MKALIALLYLAGVCHSNHQNTKDLWRNDGLGVELFRLSMREYRFKFLLQHLRFDNVEDPERLQRKMNDKFYCIREIFTEFVGRCKDNYSLGHNVTIDEMLSNFRGKCTSRVYMPKKPGKSGIKFFKTILHTLL